MHVPRPNFLCIGAQKAGTTWLYHVLRQHPQIWLPPVKELHYFDTVYLPLRSALRKALWPTRQRQNIFHRVWSRPGDWKFLAYPLWDAWYCSLFSEAGARQAGDITPCYSGLREESVARVYQLLPQAKILILLRDPVERAWSQLRQEWRVGRLDLFQEVEVRDRTQSADFHRRSRYPALLDRWGRYYPSEQIKVVYFDDIVHDPGGLVTDLCAFLGVAPPSNIRGLKQKIHPGVSLKRPDWITYYLSSLLEEDIIQLSQRLGSWAHGWARLNQARLEALRIVAGK